LQDKLTFVSLYGLDKAKQIAAQLIDDAKKSLNVFGDKAKDLQDLADFILNRRN